MATEGGIIETKQIGIPVNLNGQFINTEIKNGAIQLKTLNEVSTEYHKTGTWISEIVDIGDNFNQYENLVATIAQQDDSLEKIFTSSSIDGITFSDWVQLGASNQIMSPKNKFFKIKVDFEAGVTIGTEVIPNTNLVNEYVENTVVSKSESLVPALTSNTSSLLGIAFASSIKDTSTLAWRAFNKANTWYQSSTLDLNKGFIGFLFNDSRVVTKYRIASQELVADFVMVKDFVLEGSNDTTTGLNGTWKILDSQVGQRWNTVVSREYNFNNAESFKGYRIRWTANNGDLSNTGLNELEFFSPQTDALVLKKDYSFDMTNDESWTDEGSLYRKTVTRDEWLRINKLNVLESDNKLPVQWLPINMTSNTTPPPYIVSADSVVNVTASPAWKAFAPNEVNGWFSTKLANAWLSINLGTGIVINTYGISAVNNNVSVRSALPKNWEFQGSFNGINWNTLDSHSNFEWVSGNEVVFEFNNAIAYNHYRLFILQNGGSTQYTGLKDLRLGFRNSIEDKTLILHDGEYKKYIDYEIIESSNTSLIPIMTSDTTPSPFKITASTYNGSDFPYKAFNNVVDTTNRNYWYSGTIPSSGHWLKVDTGENDKYIVNKYSINSFNPYRPVDWNLEGSNDDSNWVIINSQTSQTYDDNIDKFYSFENNKSYRYYRISVLKTSSGNAVVTPIISKLNLYGKILEKINDWENVTSTIPTSQQFITDGMDELSPLLDRKVTTLDPIPMQINSDILPVGSEGKVFSRIVDLNKYFDIRSMKVEVR